MKKMFFAFLFVLAFSAQAQVVNQRVDLFQQSRIDIRGKTAEAIHAENLQSLAKFIAADNKDTDDDRMRPKNLNPKYAAEILKAAEANPVVSLYVYSKYDPQDQGIGFCFGRAMFVHLELAYRGFDRDSIRKAFVVGPMQTPDGGSWGWHVTTIAQSLDARGQEQWLAIDPIAGVMEVSKWYKLMRDQYSTDKKLKLYVALPTRMGPGPYAYDEDDIRNPFYNKYFTDMLAWFEKESMAGSYEKKRVVEYQLH